MGKNENLGQRVGNNVRKLRNEKHITQEKLSERSGVSINTIRNMEKGRWPSARTLELVCDALNVEAKILLSSEKDELYLREEVETKLKAAVDSILTDAKLNNNHFKRE